MKKKFTLITLEQVMNKFTETRYVFEHDSFGINFKCSDTKSKELQFEIFTKLNRKRVQALNLTLQSEGVTDEFMENKTRGFVYDFCKEFEKLVTDGENPVLKIYTPRTNDIELPFRVDMSLQHNDTRLTYNIYPVGYLTLRYPRISAMEFEVNKSIFRLIAEYYKKSLIQTA